VLVKKLASPWARQKNKIKIIITCVAQTVKIHFNGAFIWALPNRKKKVGTIPL
jgi:hypothetical protein